MEAEDDVVGAHPFDERDVQIVLSQTTASRAEVLAAMQKHDGDIVNAIMEITWPPATLASAAPSPSAT